MAKVLNHKVQLRGGFSDRNGVNKISTEIQLYDFDPRTRKCLINSIYTIISDLVANTNSFSNYENNTWEKYYLDILTNVYLFTYDQLDYEYESELKEIFDNLFLNTLNKGTYDEILTLIEYMLNLSSEFFQERKPLWKYKNDSTETEIYYYDEKAEINKTFEKECVGYRFIGKTIVPISDNIEVKEIQDAFTIQYKGAKSHLEKAVGFLSDREKPDYKNSIKESISAVESICQIIVGDDKASLGDALKDLEEKGIAIHPALKGAFSKLYGYTSDEGGIRHAEGLFESNVSFEEAKFMLVSCCAFVNYLIAEYGKTAK